MFSSGRSSFCPPRCDTFLGYLSYSKRLAKAGWHFVQFHGYFIDKDDGLKSIFREVPSTEERAKGYVRVLTNYSLYVTGSQGHIHFKSNLSGIEPSVPQHGKNAVKQSVLLLSLQDC